MRRSRTILILLCVAGCLSGPCLASDTRLVAPDSTSPIAVPTALGTVLSEFVAGATGAGARATLRLDGNAEVLEVTSTPVEGVPGEIRVEVRFDRSGAVAFLLGHDGPVLLGTDIRDCASLNELGVWRAAAAVVRSAAERLATSATPPVLEMGPEGTVATLAALAAIAVTLSGACPDAADRIVPWSCLDWVWEEDCMECCRQGRAVTDVGAIFCGAVGAMFCAPGVIATGICSGVATVTCQRIGELAERGCARSCGRLPKRPAEGRACGDLQSGICSDSCDGTIVAGDCGPGLVCCMAGLSSPAASE